MIQLPIVKATTPDRTPDVTASAAPAPAIATPTTNEPIVPMWAYIGGSGLNPENPEPGRAARGTFPNTRAAEGCRLCADYSP